MLPSWRTPYALVRLFKNKLTLYYLPYPSLVVSVQLAAALVFIYAAKTTKLLQVDPLEWKFIVPYAYYIVLFSLGVYCNMKSLSISNVETIIVFRALTPCVVAFLDAMFLGREYPSKRSWGALVLIAFGGYCYANFDTKFQAQGWSAYAWPSLYLFIIAIEMTYGKQITRSVDLKTLSGPVLYTNLLGLPSMLMFAVVGNEFHKYQADFNDGKSIPPAAAIFLLLGCIVGTGIGYSGWWCRDKVSATSFTLIGVMNKVLTVLLNLAIWDQHAPMGGILSLSLCLLGGVLYQQAPLRKGESDKLLNSSDKSDEPVCGDEETATLLGSGSSDSKDGQVKRRP